MIYQTPDNDFNNLYDAIKNKDTIIDLKNDNEIVGKLIIRHNEQEMIEQMKRELITVISLIFGLIMSIILLFIIYIYRTILKPFQQLQTFAANVARGNLDIPLNMAKNNLLVTDMFHATLEELQQLKIKVTEESSEILVDMIENVNYNQQIESGPIPPCIILMDTLRMQQVIDNIISNSYKYAGTKISIKYQINQDFLELDISDFGSGISEEELPLLFNKYFRGKNVEGKNGSGLGLYISKYFMENMEGQVNCYNRHDGFTVVLKIKLAG